MEVCHLDMGTFEMRAHGLMWGVLHYLGIICDEDEDEEDTDNNKDPWQSALDDGPSSSLPDLSSSYNISLNMLILSPHHT